MALYQELVVYGADDTTPGKVCCRCRETFADPAASFHRDPRNRDGLDARCKSCACAARKTQRERLGGEAFRERKERRLAELTAGSKTCRRCSVFYTLPAVAFGACPLNRDGLKSYCRACDKAVAQQVRNERGGAVSRAKRQALQARRRADHAIGAKTCERCGTFYPVASEDFHRGRGRYDGLHVECRTCDFTRSQLPERRARLNELARIRRRANPAQTRAIQHRRRARKLAAGGQLSARDIRILHHASGDRCFWCDKHLDGVYTLDHLHPIAKGGTNDPGNIVIACKSCNSRKNKSLPLDWAPRHWRRLQSLTAGSLS